VGNGAFGIVWRARSEEGDVVAIKKVLLDRRYHNRELQMMKVMDHESIIRLRHYFEKQGRKKDETYLHLVMDYLPETLRSVALQHHKRRKRFQVDDVKAYLWQTFRALEYIHARRICHRDIKPDNVLCDPATLRCRLCDFGCSKVLVKGQPNVSYICSRYYRAPELMLGATEYGVGVDVWSVGTILMELLLGHLPFQGQDSTQQHLVEIMKLLGTPSDRDLQAMRATCYADDLPKLRPFPWERIFPPGTSADAIDLAQRLLRYDPDQRLTASQALVHPFFDGAQQLIDRSADTSPTVSSRTSVAEGGSAAEWEARLNRYFDDLVVDGASLHKLESAMQRRVEQIATADPQLRKEELVHQVVGMVRQELVASLKHRDEAVRGVQKRLLLEAQQLKLTLPLEGASANRDASAEGGKAEVQKLSRELEAVQKQAQQAAEAAEAEKEDLLARIRAVQEQMGGGRAGGVNGACAGPSDGSTADAGVQTDEEARPSTPGYGRRAVNPPGPSRQGTGLQDNVAAASPLQQRSTDPRSSGAGPHLMVNTDNLGQVTPLSSFSPVVNNGSGSSPLATGAAPRTTSAGRRASGRTTRLAEGHAEASAAPES